MSEDIMTVDALTSFLVTTFHVNKVRVKKEENSIFIEPVIENIEDKKYSCPFLGTAKGGSLTVDKFLELKQAEKELELENEKRLFS
jgi:hypothetical protein